MKRTVIVNISGIVFNIDEDAYIKLSNYLNAINNRFTTDEGKEIIDDVESRIAELFQQNLSPGKQVITIEDVNAMIDIMGNPEDYSESTEEEAPKRKTIETEKTSYRRFYRDPDNRVVGGVCSGISAYFDIDPVILRVIFAASFILFGSGLIVYIILWIAMPEAATTAQKLEMRGERVNVSNIERSIKDEFQKVNVKLRTIGRKTNFGEILENIFHVLGKIFMVFARIIAIIIGVVFVIAGTAIVVGLFSAIFFSAKVGSHSLPLSFFSHHIVGDGSLFWLLFGVFLLIGIPVIYLIYAGIRIVFRIKTKVRYVGIVALGLWFVGLGLCISFGLNIASHFSEEVAKTDIFPIDNSKAKSITIRMASNSFIDERDVRMHFGRHGIFFSREDNILRGHPEIGVERSTNGKIELAVKYIASENDRKLAAEIARKIIYNWKMTDSTLTFEPYFQIQENTQWRNQEVELILRVPEGIYVNIDENTNDYLRYIANPENYNDWEMGGKRWLMKDNGLNLVSGIHGDSIKVDEQLEDMKEELKK